jgi:hypothetical protein
MATGCRECVAPTMSTDNAITLLTQRALSEQSARRNRPAGQLAARTWGGDIKGAEHPIEDECLQRGLADAGRDLREHDADQLLLPLLAHQRQADPVPILEDVHDAIGREGAVQRQRRCGMIGGHGQP